MSEKEYLMKIVLLGELEITFGLISSFMQYKVTKAKMNRFRTFQIDIDTRKILLDRTHVKLMLVHLWVPLLPNSLQHLKGSSYGVLFLFNKASPESFMQSQSLFHTFLTYTSNPQIPKALIGILSDSDAVPTESGQAFADSSGMAYYELPQTDSAIFEDILSTLARKALHS